MRHASPWMVWPSLICHARGNHAPLCSVQATEVLVQSLSFTVLQPATGPSAGATLPFFFPPINSYSSFRCQLRHHFLMETFHVLKGSNAANIATVIFHLFGCLFDIYLTLPQHQDSWRWDQYIPLLSECKNKWINECQLINQRTFFLYLRN